VDPLAALDAFADTPADRVVASAAISLALVLLVWVVNRLLGPARERVGRAAFAVASAVVLAATGAAGLALLRVWEGSPGAQSAFAGLETRGWLFGAQLVLTLLLFFAVYLVTRLVRRGVEQFAEGRQSVSQHQIEVTFRTGQVVLYTFSLILVLGVWGVNLGGLLVGAGFLGIVVGMAARQTLGAMLAGFVLMFSRPFEIGDWIAIGDKEGIVTDITVVNTRIQTFDGEYVMVPNDIVASNEVVNRSRKGRLRLQIEVGVDYEADVDHAMTVAREALGDVEEILSVPQPQVVATRFDDSAVVLSLRVWIDKPSARRKWRARSAVVRAVKDAFEAEGITIPFPQRTVSGRDGPVLDAAAEDDG